FADMSCMGGFAAEDDAEADDGGEGNEGNVLRIAYCVFGKTSRIGVLRVARCVLRKASEAGGQDRDLESAWDAKGLNLPRASAFQFRLSGLNHGVYVGRVVF